MSHLPELKLYLEVKCNEKLPKCGRLYKLVLKKIIYSKYALLFPQKKTVYSFSWTPNDNLTELLRKYFLLLLNKQHDQLIFS